MHVHKLVGGSRVVDCMGPDPKPISWNGRFRDADAPARARSVEHLCASGALVGVSWGSFFYMVVVSEFECDYESRREIPYKVTLTVVPSFLGSQFASISALISSDLTALSGLGALL